jgi:nucleotide-binding universal stress UspA family protein
MTGAHKRRHRDGHEPAGSPAGGLACTCPMHPEVRSSEPGFCAKCGMALEPIGRAERIAPAARITAGAGWLWLDAHQNPFRGRADNGATSTLTEQAMYKHILIPTDGSELSKRAVHEGVDFAKSINAQVTFLTASLPFKVFATDALVVSETPETYNQGAEKVAQRRFADATEYARQKGVTAIAQHVFAEHPFEAIIDTAKKNHCDLIFMASHGRKGVKGLVLGSETNKVLTHSKIPVQVYR